MKKIINPYRTYKEYNCFGCSPNNPLGLQMEFYEGEDEIICEWEPKESFQGYYNVLHGGVITSLTDEIASWVVLIKLKTSGVTSRLDTRFIKPVYTNNGKVILKAKVRELARRLAFIEVKLYDKENVLCTESVVQYFTFPEKIARERFHYPGYDAFFKPVDQDQS